MSLAADLLALEESFWTGGPDVYRAATSEDVVMLFPGAPGPMHRNEILEAVEASPRWSAVTIEDPEVRHLGDDAALLAYRATGHRAIDGFAYTTLACSVYRRDDEGWRLVLHQQTPI